MATAAVTRATVTALALGNVFTFHGWNGWIPDLQAVVDPYQRLGATGTGAQQTAKIGRRVGITGFRFASDQVGELVVIAQWESVQGQVFKIIDPWGRNLARVRLTDTAIATPRVGKGPLDSNGLQSTMLVVYTATAERLPDTT